MIKNIVLDMGNVLLTFNPEVCLQTFLDNDADRAIIRRELFEGPEWIQGDYGIITNAQRYEPVSKRVPARLHASLKNCVDKWDMCMKPVPGAMDFCKYIKDKGYGIYVLSNACNGFYDYFPNFAEISYFDGVLVSSDIHMIKPEAGIYTHFLEVYGLNPEECLFIDDRPENVEGGLKAGMQGFIFAGDFEAIKTTYTL